MITDADPKRIPAMFVLCSIVAIAGIILCVFLLLLMHLDQEPEPYPDHTPDWIKRILSDDSGSDRD